MKINTWLKLDEMGVGIALALLILLFTLLSPEFMSLRTWGSIATFASVLGVIAIGATLLMIAGEFDLSVGSVAALSGMVFAMGVVNWEMSTYLMAGIALAIGAGIGLLNGVVTLKTQIPSFITTLGAMLVWRGVVLGVSGGFPISLVDDRSGVLLWFGSKIGEGFYSATLFWLGITVVFAWLLKLTRFGNHVLATGGDSKAARGMGVNTTKVKLICFTLSGALAALAGLILFSQLQDLSPTAGESYELYAIAASVIGGTALTGGRGTVVGTILGTLLMGVVQAGLVHAGVDSYWFRTFVGLILVFAVILNLKLRQVAERSPA